LRFVIEVRGTECVCFSANVSFVCGQIPSGFLDALQSNMTLFLNCEFYPRISVIFLKKGGLDGFGFGFGDGVFLCFEIFEQIVKHRFV
jgi:hypothetical protein